MGRKRNPYLPLFTRDIMSSPRCRALSREAAGVYLFLLCRLNEPPTPGAYRISDWEEHASWSRSKTTRCLAEPDKYSRLQYFAKMLSVNDLPWRERDILESLQELYKYGIITVEGDALIQPRMFADNGFTLDAEGTILDDPHSGSMALRGDEAAMKTADKNRDFLSAKKGTEKDTKKVHKKVHEKAPVSHAGASRAESESENIDNNSNIGGAGENEAKNKNVRKKPENTSVATIDGKPVIEVEGEGPLFTEFWEAYDKQVNMSEAQAYWDVLSVKDHEAIMAYIPQYIQAQPQKRFRKNPVTFLRNRAWEDEIIREHEPINNNGYEGSKTYQNGAASSSRGNQGQDNDAMRDQTVRIVQRLRANRQTDSPVEPNARDTEG